jgi:hypothetical protein
MGVIHIGGQSGQSPFTLFSPTDLRFIEAFLGQHRTICAVILRNDADSCWGRLRKTMDFVRAGIFDCDAGHIDPVTAWYGPYAPAPGLDAMRQQYAHAHHQMVESLAHCIRCGIASGEISRSVESGEAAELFLTSLIGACLRAIAENSSVALERCEQFLKLLLHRQAP